VCVCVRARARAYSLWCSAFFFKFRHAVVQGQFSGYRELNSRPVTCWTVSCKCLLLSVHFGIPRGPYIKIHQKLYSARSSSEYTDQLLLMRCLWCRPPLLFFTWIIWHFYPNTEGTAVAQWLRCCATNRKVACSIPAGVGGFFIDIKPFRSHYCLGVDSASNRNEYQGYFLGVKVAGA